VKRADVALALEWSTTASAAVLWAGSAQWRDLSPITGAFFAPSSAILVAGLVWLAIGLGARWWRTGRILPRTPFDWPILLLLLGTLIGWLVAYNRDLGLLKLHAMVGAAAIFYLLANTGQLAGGRAGAAFVVLAAASALIFPTQHDYHAVPADFEWLTRIGLRTEGIIPSLPVAAANPNVVAGILAMACPFGFAWLRRELTSASGGRRWRAIIPILALAALLFGLMMTSSRQAWIALAGTAGLWAIARAGRRVAGRWGEIAAGALAVAVGLGVYLTIVARPALGAALPLADAAIGRAAIYRDAFYLGADTLFTGAGLGNYELVYSTYSLLLHVGFLAHAHQWFLQTWLEGGLLGLVGLVSIIMTAVWLVVRDAMTEHERPWFRPAAKWAVVVAAIQGLFDFPLADPRAVLISLVPIGLLLAGRSQRQSSLGAPHCTGHRSHRRLVVLALALVAAAVIWRRPLLAFAYANAGAIEQDRIELQDYDWPRWSIQDEIRRTANLDRAIAAYGRALDFDPGNATANRRLGMIELARQDYERALVHLERAYAATPGDVATRQLLGEAYIVNGRLEEGAALWSTLDRHQGQLTIRAWWYSNLADAQRQKWIEEIVNDLDP
jgi:tetratricopeptide (TPR) repeat protein